MEVGIAGLGFVGSWGADLDILINANPAESWQKVTVDRIAIDAGKGILTDSGTDNGDAWAKAESTTITLGRQAFGRVSLYWCQTEQGLWFATRLRWLLPLVKWEIDPIAVYSYACFSYVTTPLTPIKSIHAIAAGEIQTWEQGQIDPTKRPCLTLSHWQEQETLLNDEATAIKELRTLLELVVFNQVSDLKNETVGVLLSGGLDSAIVAALLSRSGLKVRAYTLDFGKYGISEVPYAEQVANYLKIPLIKIDCSPHKVKRSLLEVAKALDLPFGDGVSVPFWLLYQTALQDCDLLFNGEGGDQLFGGWTNKPLIAASLYQTSPSTFAEQYLQTFHRLWGYGERVFSSIFWQMVKDWQPVDSLESALDGSGSLLSRLRRATLMLKGAQNIHPRATNMALDLGLRLRSPFCDEDLAQWTFGVDSSLFLQGACEKYIMKRAVEPWLPAEIVWRPKRGMGVPLTQWCLEPLWHDLGKWLNPGLLETEGIWRSDLASSIVFGQLSGNLRKRRIGEILWLLLQWQFWQSQMGVPIKDYSWGHPFHLPYWFWERTNLHRECL